MYISTHTHIQHPTHARSKTRLNHTKTNPEAHVHCFCTTQHNNQKHTHTSFCTGGAGDIWGDIASTLGLADTAVFVCLWVCVWVCMCMCSALGLADTPVYVCLCVCECMFMCMCMSMSNLILAPWGLLILLCTYVCVYVCACVRICVWVWKIWF